MKVSAGIPVGTRPLVARAIQFPSQTFLTASKERLKEHSTYKRHFPFAESHQKCPIKGCWTKPLARQLGGRAAWRASVWGGPHLGLTSSRGISVVSTGA